MDDKKMNMHCIPEKYILRDKIEEIVGEYTIIEKERFNVKIIVENKSKIKPLRKWIDKNIRNSFDISIV